MRALLLALLFGLVAFPVHAETLLLVSGRTLDRPKILAYGAALPPIYAAHEGRYLGLGGPGRGVRWLVGPWTDRSLVLARFPDAARLQGFWWGAAYRDAIRLRDQAGVFTAMGLDGAGAPPGPGAGYLVLWSAEPLAAPLGGSVIVSAAAETLLPLEGDSAFARVTVVAFETPSARDAFLASRSGKRLLAAGKRQALFAAAALDGVK